jgi:GntR family transcriptional regulator, galactonate operon transcriptional repressor
MQKQLGKSAALAISVSDELVDRIVSGTYVPGSWIPTEVQLALEFGVSRTVIRESIQMLIGKGMLRIERGRGTAVLDETAWRALDPVVLSARLRHNNREAILSELLTLRKGLEPELAALACERLDEGTLLELSAKIEDLRRNMDDLDEYQLADAAFHRCIIEIADVSLASELFKLLSEPLGIVRTLVTALDDEEVEHSMRDHTEIFESIVARDPRAARRAVREHIEWQRLTN